MKFYKYHGLGNDYLVMNPIDGVNDLSPFQIQMICHRHYGMGSDGILFGPDESPAADFALRIFNPDGSEAEKSGNGLRIFARYLYDCGTVRHDPFSIATIGGVVKAQVHPDMTISVDMGTISFDSASIPVTGPRRQVLNDRLIIDEREIIYSAATIGNPHCVVIRDTVSPELAKNLGPKLETHPNFPNKTNVQFMTIMDRANIMLEIWERGAGYTLASGSSSSAAAAVAYKLGLTDANITVHMPGGKLSIRVGENFSIALNGPVIRVGEGVIDSEIFQQKKHS
ncbi:MAG: diaminopimelate epimerase [Desulfobacteraceae bacterium]|nr:diaminopimelate epimerase [Desulfobacteraceae bacterium]